MSLTKPRHTSNPATKFIQWSGKHGHFYYYDKESKDNIVLDFPLYIIVLDQLSCVTGYNKKKNTGIFSNDVHDLRIEPLNVRLQGGTTIAHGLYSHIKGDLQGGKYTKSVYAMLINTASATENELVNIKFAGSALNAWITSKIVDGIENVIILKGKSEPLKNGDTTYYEPLISIAEKNSKILEHAAEMDKKLQDYLGSPTASQPDTVEGNEPSQYRQDDPDLNPPEDFTPPPPESETEEGLPDWAK